MAVSAGGGGRFGSRGLERGVPWLEEIYRDMAEYMSKPEEVLNMFSEALKILDQNTVQYMIDLQQKELEMKDRKLEEQQKELKEQQGKLEEQQQLLKEQDSEVRRQNEENQKLRKEIARLQKQLAERAE